MVTFQLSLLLTNIYLSSPVLISNCYGTGTVTYLYNQNKKIKVELESSANSECKQIPHGIKASLTVNTELKPVITYLQNYSYLTTEEIWFDCPTCSAFVASISVSIRLESDGFYTTVTSE